MEQQLQQERIVIENDDEIEIDLKDLVLEILSFWKWVLFALIIGAVTAYCISRFVMVPQYESTSQFYVLSKSMSITSLADIQTGTSLTNDYMVIVEGRPVLEQVIENLGLDETYSSLKKKVTLNNPSNSRILEITVRDANPSMAKKIADEIARVSVAFIQQKMDQDAPNIIQKGYSDGEPVSPNTVKNTAIGGILGMFLAIAVSLMNLENVRILKEMRNSVNRKVNCETANINKTVNAAVKQMEDIKRIRDTIGFDNIPEPLAEIAQARLDYPEATLKELGTYLDPPVGKSGVNHRLRKLAAIAENLI